MMQTFTIEAYVQTARPVQPRRIIVHDPGQPAGPDGIPEPVSAAGVAHFNATPPAQRNPQGTGGYHRVGSQSTYVISAPDMNRVDGASSANNDGLHYCLTDYSDEALSMMALQFHAWNHLYSIPLVFNDVAHAGDEGWTTHAVIEQFIHASSPHTDARLFPMDRFNKALLGADPTRLENPLTTIALPTTGRTQAGRDATARPSIELGLVLLENGARLAGDQANGGQFTWRHPKTPANAKMIDITDLRPNGVHAISAIYDEGDPKGPATYRAEILPHY